MSFSAWTKPPCLICRRAISAAGFARVRHLRSHVRAGLLIERTRLIQGSGPSYTRVEFRMTELGWAKTGRRGYNPGWLTSFQL